MTKTIDLPERGVILPPEIDDATRREFLIGAAGLLLLPAGCGSGEEAGNEPSGETKTVEHALGTTKVPVNLEKIVVLNSVPTECLLALSIKPTGVPAQGALVSHLQEDVGDIDTVGTENEPSIERIAGLNPDVILGLEWQMEQTYEQMSEIGPTVALSADAYVDWKQAFGKVAEVVGRENDARRLLGDYESRLEDFRSGMGSRLDETTVSVLRIGATRFTIYQKESFPGTILEEAGVERPASQNVDDFAVDLSREEIAEADADAVFLFSFGATSEEDVENRREVEEISRTPLWRRLEAVQENRVYEVGDYWSGAGFIAANLILDDLEKHLL